MPETYVHELPMRWADLDLLNHVNNVVYVDYAAEALGLLQAEGVVDPAASIARMSVSFRRPLLLTRRPIEIVSTLDGDVLTQDVTLPGDDGVRTVFATVTTVLAPPVVLEPEDIRAELFDLHARRADVGPDGTVPPSTVFLLFQEARILYLAGALERHTAGSFVVGSIDVTFGAPFGWRPEPYLTRTWFGAVGTASVRLGSEILDGDLVLASAVTVMVGYDAETQSSRPFTDAERAFMTS